VLARRIIPCLDIKDGRVVKGTSFVGLRDAGDPVELAQRYNTQSADELVFLDITASKENRSTTLELAARLARELFIPFTIGGGISTPEDIHALVSAGADKTSVNSAALRNPDLISEGAKHFGSQCIVVAIDAKRVPESKPIRWEVFSHGGQPQHRTRCRRLGAGGGRAWGRRNPAHQHGRRRAQGRLRP